jgi:hypothetical protein
LNEFVIYGAELRLDLCAALVTMYSYLKTTRSPSGYPLESPYRHYLR